MFDSLPKLPRTRRWRGQTHPVATVLAIVCRDAPAEEHVASARYLLIQRQSEPYAGKWGLVGGRWEFAETLKRAIKREVKEETGLDTRFLGLCGVINERIAPHSANDAAAHFLLFVCKLSASSGDARQQHEGPVAWFNLEDLSAAAARHEIISSDYRILRRFARADAPMAFIEAEVIAGSNAGDPGRLLRFVDVDAATDR